jgi:hypothetical protein
MGAGQAEGEMTPEQEPCGNGRCVAGAPPRGAEGERPIEFPRCGAAGQPLPAPAGA